MCGDNDRGYATQTVEDAWTAEYFKDGAGLPYATAICICICTCSYLTPCTLGPLYNPLWITKSSGGVNSSNQIDSSITADRFWSRLLRSTASQKENALTPLFNKCQFDHML